ncbi:MAG: agmatine deiminase family protein [Myxococcales bacterium]|nr:agmatine deiminase family protein [Myxococcales bacterium]
MSPVSARRSLFICGATALLAFSCTKPVQTSYKAAPQAVSPQRVFIEAGSPELASNVILPAFETAVERLNPAKSDAADDYRAQHKEWFAQTQGLTPGRFRPFGEWEEMQGVWTSYSNGMVNSKAVRRMFAEQTINFIRHSTPKVRAYVIVNNANVGNDFMKAVTQYGIKDSEKAFITIVTLPVQTIWHIDYGPFPMIEKKTGNVAFTDFVYYPNRQYDDALPTRIGHEFYKDATVYRMPFGFEGGNVQTDGKGTCMTSFRALKNTGFSALKMRNMLKNYMACEKTLIVQDISDDGTGHIDMFFKWSSENEVIMGKYENDITLDYDGDGKSETLPMPGAVAADYQKTFKLNQKRMEENTALFESTTAANGKKYKVHRLSMMTRFKDEYGNLPRTFINSTFTNGVNVYPSYTPKSCQNPAGSVCKQDSDCASGEHCGAGKCTKGPVLTGCDEIVKCASGLSCVSDPLKVAIIAQVQKQWETALPDMKHVGLRADTIALWSGAIHCITRTIPTGKFVKAIDDGNCLGGTCGCSEGGMTGACSADTDCFGPAWICDCNVCKGKCKGANKNCTDDADCAPSGATLADIVAGSCVIDSAQTCAGQQPSAGNKSSCGSLSYEGHCQGKALKFCSPSGGGAKQLTCGNCCGWSSDSKAYDCLDSSLCGKCAPECDKAGETGCGVQGKHSWTCVDEGGCLKRKWNYCGDTSQCNAGVCSETKQLTCPPKTEKDAGSTEADAGSTGSDIGGGTGVKLDGEGTDGGGTTKTGGGGDSSGCTAAPTSRGSGWLALLLAALALVAVRRRRVV